MTLFIDASAVVAMVAMEPDALELADRIDGAAPLLWSPIVQWEAMAAMKRIRDYSPTAARRDIAAFGREYGITPVSIGEHEGDLASHAFQIYGRRSGHPAQLNMGDCFAYACAKANDARLLYKGDDFARTDLAWRDHA